MLSKLARSRQVIWSVGGLLFGLLCFACISQHGSELAGLADAGEAAPTVTLAAPQLDARLLDGRVMLTGTLPDQSSKAQVVARARELYGDGKYVDNLKVSSQTAFPTGSWLGTALALLPFANRVGNEGGFVLEQATVTLRGMVEGEDIRSRLVSEAILTAGKNVRVEDQLRVKGYLTAAQATDFQSKLNAMIAGKIVEFDTDSDALTGRGKAVLDTMVTVLAQYPGVPVEVGGHTDARGDAALNQSLSERRARTCLQYLSEKGVAAQRLSARGYGATQPLADNNTPEGQQRNRRIEFTVQREGK